MNDFSTYLSLVSLVDGRGLAWSLRRELILSKLNPEYKYSEKADSTGTLFHGSRKSISLHYYIYHRNYTVNIVYHVNDAQNLPANIIYPVNGAQNAPTAIIYHVNDAQNPPTNIIFTMSTMPKHTPAGIVYCINPSRTDNN
jgi:hypothetical protein